MSDNDDDSYNNSQDNIKYNHNFFQNNDSSDSDSSNEDDSSIDSNDSLDSDDSSDSDDSLDSNSSNSDNSLDSNSSNSDDSSNSDNSSNSVNSSNSDNSSYSIDTETIHTDFPALIDDNDVRINNNILVNTFMNLLEQELNNNNNTININTEINNLENIEGNENVEDMNIINVQISAEEINDISVISNRKTNELIESAFILYEEKYDFELYEKINEIYLTGSNLVSNSMTSLVDKIYCVLYRENYTIEEITIQLVGYAHFYDNYFFKDYELLKSCITKQLLKIYDLEGINNLLNNHVEERYEQNRVKLILEQDEIDKLKKDHYNNYNDIIQKNNINCSVCLVDFEKTDETRLLKCEHLFHTECIDNWLLNFSHKCPVCRTECENYKTNI